CAVWAYLRQERQGESVWHARVAPTLAVAGLGVILWLVLANFAGLIGVTGDSPLRWGIPVTYLLVGLAGTGYGLNLRTRRPDTSAAIGLGAKAGLPARYGQFPPMGPLLDLVAPDPATGHQPHSISLAIPDPAPVGLPTADIPLPGVTSVHVPAG